MSVSCLILADAPEPDALTVLDAKPGVAVSRVQIAKTGSFKDPRYGKFKITRADFARWLSNFETLHKAPGRLGLPIDVDHSPEKFGKTEAAGWVTNLDTMGQDGKTSTPDELWATAEWNSLGQAMIADRRYAYLSPSYQHDYKDEQGKSHGTAMVGIGLTNRPFLTMATVTLSRALDAVAAAAEEVADTTPDSPGSMPDFIAQIREALGLDESTDDATVLAKARELAAAGAAPPPAATEKTLAQLAAESGSVVLSAADHASLTQNALAGAAAAKQLHEQRFEVAFDKALEDPSGARVTPAMKDNLKALYDKAPDLTLSTIEAMPVMVQTSAAGATGARSAADDPALQLDAGGFDVDEDRVELHNKTLAIAAQKGIDYADALQLAAAELGVR